MNPAPHRETAAPRPPAASLPTTTRVAITCGALLSALGCGTDLGVCDEAAARRVVYDEGGAPAYEGQALVHASCGRGIYCHSEQAEGLERYGAPAALDFDVDLVFGDDGDALERLRRGQAAVRRHRRAILREVERGTMPPWGAATEIVHEGTPRYRRADGTRLDYVDSHEGIEALRNWLACDAPVVERTDGAGTVGDVVPFR